MTHSIPFGLYTQFEDAHTSALKELGRSERSYTSWIYIDTLFAIPPSGIAIVLHIERLCAHDDGTFRSLSPRFALLNPSAPSRDVLERWYGVHQLRALFSMVCQKANCKMGFCKSDRQLVVKVCVCVCVFGQRSSQCCSVVRSQFR